MVHKDDHNGTRSHTGIRNSRDGSSTLLLPYVDVVDTVEDKHLDEEPQLVEVHISMAYGFLRYRFGHSSSNINDGTDYCPHSKRFHEEKEEGLGYITISC